MADKVIKAYKGFNKDLSCRDQQYEVGREYKLNGKAIVCNYGFHACENPFDVLSYYGDILNDRYCEVESSGDIAKDNDNTKFCSTRIKIKAEIGFAGLFKAGIEWLKEITDPKNIIKETKEASGTDVHNDNGERYAKIGSSGNGAKIGSSGDGAQIGSSGNGAKIGSSGDGAQIGSSGYGAQIGSSGDGAQIGSSGYGAKIDCSGKYSVVAAIGINSKAKASLGSWITLAEYNKRLEYIEEIGKWLRKPICVKTEYVDGERIKADTFYKLKDGEFIEVL